MFPRACLLVFEELKGCFKEFFLVAALKKRGSSLFTLTLFLTFVAD